MQESEDEICLISKPVNGVLNISTKDDSQTEVDEAEEETINPFVHKLPLHSFYDRLKLIFMTIFVLPIRVFFILICLLLAYLFVTVGMIGLSQEDLFSKPLSGWRRACKNQAVNWLRFLYFIYGFHYVPVKGLQAHPREAPLLVVAPHSSMFDALPVLIMGAPSIVAKGEVQGLPVFSKCINFTQPVYVWREDTNSRQNTISEIRRRVTSDLDWSQIMIFPEGTCTNRSCLITFKPGAFYPGVPVQPVVLRYPNVTDCITWTWDGPGAAKILWVTLCQFLNRCEVEYLPVYHPSPEEKEDPRLFARNVRQVMADALKVPVMDYTYDDCRIMHKAKLKNLPCNTGLVEFQKLRYRLKNLNLKNVEGELMDEYAEMAQTNHKIGLSDFSKYLGIPPTEPTVIELFNSYDRESCGLVSFKCFLMTRAEFLEKAVSEENISKAFECFTKAQEDNKVSAGGFAQVLEDSVQLSRKIADKLFQEIDSEEKSFLTLEDFKSIAKRKPDYAQLFYLYRKSIEDGSRTSQVKKAAQFLSMKKKKLD